MPDDSEKIENLGGGVRAIVTKEHTFGADAVLLAHFSAPKNGQRLCDLGTGCGIIPLLWCRNGGPFVIDAFEIQEQAVKTARRAAELNSLPINVFHTDLRNIDLAQHNSYDLISCNPPYNRMGAANLSKTDADATARHEAACTLEDVITVSARLLKQGGRLCLCHRPERIADIFTLMRASGLEPKRMRFVQQNRSAKPWLVLLEGRRGGRPGLDVLPVLMNEEAGAVSQEMRLIYGNYQE